MVPRHGGHGADGRGRGVRRDVRVDSYQIWQVYGQSRRISEQ